MTTKKTTDAAATKSSTTKKVTAATKSSKPRNRFERVVGVSEPANKKTVSIRTQLKAGGTLVIDGKARKVKRVSLDGALIDVFFTSGDPITYRDPGAGVGEPILMKTPLSAIDDVNPTPVVPKVTKAERAAAKKDIKNAAKVTKKIKASMAAEAPVTPLTKLFTKAGFVHVRSEAVDDRTLAHGYKHADGSVALFSHDSTNTEIGSQWTIKRADGTQEAGQTAKALAVALIGPVTVPAHVLSAITLLGKFTKNLYRLNDLAGDANYKARIQLLKKLLSTDKVLVKQSGVNNLIKAFYTALDIKAASAAAMATAFEARCKELTNHSRKVDSAVQNVEAAEIKEVMKRTAGQREVHDGKPILPGIKKLSAKKQKEADDKMKAELAAQIAHKRRQEEYTPIAVPRPEATIHMNLADICLLEDPNNGIVLMCLEKPNSQGAICVYNNGSRVAVGVVPTEVLNSLRPLISEDLIRDVNQLLHPITAGVIVTPQAEQQLTAVLDYCKENIIMNTANETVKTKKFAPPAGTAKKVAAKSATKNEKPAKKAAKAKTEKAPRVTEDKKIKALVTLKSEGLPREGSFCYGQVEAIIGSKTVAEAQAKLDKSKLNPSGRKLEVAWLVKKGYLQVIAA